MKRLIQLFLLICIPNYNVHRYITCKEDWKAYILFFSCCMLKSTNYLFILLKWIVLTIFFIDSEFWILIYLNQVIALCYCNFGNDEQGFYWISWPSTKLNVIWKPLPRPEDSLRYYELNQSWLIRILLTRT